MSLIRPTIALEFELSAGVWTDVTRDVRAQHNIDGRYGIQGSGPLDRVASVGTLRFALNNSRTNSAGLVGYYSPDHANVRSGFRVGMGVRLAITYEGTTYYKWRGTMEEIVPEAGYRHSKTVFCTAVDWMAEAVKHNISGLGVQTDQRSDQIFATVLATVPKQPPATSIGVGMDTYAYALDNTRDEEISVIAEFERLAMSELGYVFVKGDGTLVFEDRRRRGATTVNVQTFDNTMLLLDARRRRDGILNKFQVILHPRRVDTTPVILYSLQSQPLVSGGASLTIIGPYRDPTQTSARTGGTGMIEPVASTDYTMNTVADGTGSDLTSSFSVVAEFGGNGVRFTITNNSTQDAYITKLQARGYGIYDFENAIVEAVDQSSVDEYGGNQVVFDMFYQNDVQTGQDAGAYLLGLHKNALTDVTKCGLYANASDTLMRAFLAREISDRVGLAETVTGLASTRGYFINAVAFSIKPGNVIHCEWTLAPADQATYWILEQVGASELDETTRLGYGLFDRYWVLGSSGSSELGVTTRVNR